MCKVTASLNVMSIEYIYIIVIWFGHLLYMMWYVSYLNLYFHFDTKFVH